MGRKDRTTSHRKRVLSLGAATIVALAMFAVEMMAQTSGEGLPSLEARVEPLRPGVTESQVLAELAAHNEKRKAALHDYTVLRTYQVVDLKGKVHAEEIGRMEFFSPDKKTFTVTSESGSGLVRHMALNPLINSEIEAAAGKEHHDSAISTDNYSLNLLGEQQLGPYRCFVAEAVPKRKAKYLFEGKVWIDANDYSVVRIEGHPATKLSFWIQHADFLRQYQKVDGFWLPEQDQTLVQVRLYGKKILKIEHRNYVVNAGPSTDKHRADPPDDSADMRLIWRP
jgi:outer membrane lipoprotein-sorting protein